jgi:hypothetical protein
MDEVFYVLKKGEKYDGLGGWSKHLSFDTRFFKSIRAAKSHLLNWDDTTGKISIRTVQVQIFEENA